MIFMGAVGRCFECEQPGAGLFTRCLRLRRWQHGRSQYAIRRCYFATWHARSIENPPAKTRTRAAGSACLALPAQKYSEKSRKFMYQRAQGARDQRAHVLLAAYRSLTPTHPSPPRPARGVAPAACTGGPCCCRGQPLRLSASVGNTWLCSVLPLFWHLGSVCCPLPGRVCLCVVFLYMKSAARAVALWSHCGGRACRHLTVTHVCCMTQRTHACLPHGIVNSSSDQDLPLQLVSLCAFYHCIRSGLVPGPVWQRHPPVLTEVRIRSCAMART